MLDFSIDDLITTIRDRALAPSAHSYTSSLLEAGPQRIARKFGEESIELIVALITDDKRAVTAEAADVMFHLLVALQSRGVSFEEVLAELKRRTAQSGIAEKAARRTAT